jgi:hypothetical protein
LRVDHPLQGIAWMVAGVFLLSVMDALSKHAVSQLSIPVLIAARSLRGAGFAAAVGAAQRGLVGIAHAPSGGTFVAWLVVGVFHVGVF